MRIRYQIALGLLALGILYYVLSFVLRIVRLMFLTGGEGMCPNCGATIVKPSSPRRLLDLPYRVFFMHPYRCVVCEQRFFSRRPRAAKTALGSASSSQSEGEPSRNGA